MEQPFLPALQNNSLNFLHHLAQTSPSSLWVNEKGNDAKIDFSLELKRTSSAPPPVRLLWKYEF